MVLLEITDLEVRYGNALALDGILERRRRPTRRRIGAERRRQATLLKAISRTVPPASGSVVFNGPLPEELPAHNVVGRGICHCPRGPAPFPELSVLKHPMLALCCATTGVASRGISTKCIPYSRSSRRAPTSRPIHSREASSRCWRLGAHSGRSNSAAVGRALGRNRATPQGRNLPFNSRNPASRHRRAAGGAGCPQYARDRRANLCIGARPRGP